MKTSLEKMNLHSFKLYRAFLDPLNWSNMGDFSWISILKDCSRVQKENEKLFAIKRSIRKFHIVVVQWTSKKCTKKSDARAELLFCSQHQFYFDVVVVVVVVV